MLNDWHHGAKCEIHMRCDGSAASDMSPRRGFGETRRVDVRFLWLQQAVQEGRLKVLSVPTSENLSDTFRKCLSQADDDSCFRCMNFHMGNVGNGRHKKARKHLNYNKSESITNLNELQTINDVSGKFGSMRPITSLKHDTSLNVSVQKFDSVENSTLRNSASCLRSVLTSLEDSSLRDNLKLRGQFFAFLKLVNSIAEGALSPRSLHVFSQYSLSTASIVATVLSESTVVFIGFHTFQLQLCCTMTRKTATAVLAQDRVHVS